MTTFVFRTEDDDDLGFLLFADHEGDWPPAGPNSCMFSGFGFDPQLMRDPRWRLIQDNKGREVSASVSYTDTEMTISLALAEGGAMVIRSNANGTSWRATQAEQSFSGVGEFTWGDC